MPKQNYNPLEVNLSLIGFPENVTITTERTLVSNSLMIMEDSSKTINRALGHSWDSYKLELFPLPIGLRTRYQTFVRDLVLLPYSFYGEEPRSAIGIFLNTLILVDKDEKVDLPETRDAIKTLVNINKDFDKFIKQHIGSGRRKDTISFDEAFGSKDVLVEVMSKFKNLDYLDKSSETHKEHVEKIDLTVGRIIAKVNVSDIEISPETSELVEKILMVTSEYITNQGKLTLLVKVTIESLLDAMKTAAVLGKVTSEGHSPKYDVGNIDNFMANENFPIFKLQPKMDKMTIKDLSKLVTTADAFATGVMVTSVVYADSFKEMRSQEFNNITKNITSRKLKFNARDLSNKIRMMTKFTNNVIGDFRTLDLAPNPLESVIGEFSGNGNYDVFSEYTASTISDLLSGEMEVLENSFHELREKDLLKELESVTIIPAKLVDLPEYHNLFNLSIKIAALHNMYDVYIRDIDQMFNEMIHAYES